MAAVAANGQRPASAPSGTSSSSSSSLQLNIESFSRRLKVLFANWKDNQEASWNQAQAFAIATPPTSEDLRYLKSSTLQIWLLGYEFPETVMVFGLSPPSFHVICSTKKAAHLSAVHAACKTSTGVDMVLHARPRQESGEQQMRKALDAIRDASGSQKVLLGQLQKEAVEGPVMKTWAEVVSALVSDGEVESVDVSGALCDVFAVKEEGEITNVRKAAFLGAQVLKLFVVPKLELLIDEEKSATHADLMDQTEAVITEPAKIKVKLKAENCDICYPPVFQSGGKFDLRASAMSNEEALCYDTQGVIICCIGARYDSYCSNIARTYLIDATPQQEKAYKALSKAQDAAIGAIRPGNKLSDAYAAALAVVEKEAPELIPHLTKNVGTGIGIEFRESGLTLNQRNERRVKPGMVFNVAIGLQGLKNEQSNDPKTKDYALMLADTVVVRLAPLPGGPPDRVAEVATASCSKSFSDVAYLFKDDEEEEEEEGKGGRRSASQSKSDTAGSGGRGGGDSSILQAHLRSDSQVATKEQLRRQHQAELAKQKIEETARRLAAGGVDPREGGGTKRSLGELIAYRDVDEIPAAPRELMIQVDQRHEAVLLPIYGLLVPFHISLLKSVTAQHEGGKTLIRVIFNVPGAGFSASDFPVQNFPDSIFVKEISFRSSDSRHANQVVQMMKTMSKQVKQREVERADRASLVTQEKLQLAKGRPARLPDLWIRPSFGGKGRKITGVLEAHANGFRYATARQDERVDIMYGNIKHAFFQPAVNEMITLLHFHLHNQIMVGKKKTKDVQFFSEVMDVVQTVGSRRSALDPDEIEEEQRERERRNRINADFEIFVKRVQEQWEKDPNIAKLDLEFDVPFRELGFHGVPHKASTFIVPSVHCLVELIEQPFFVITLSEVEIVNLERVGLGHKTFDMAIVFKDFRRDVIRIDAIPSQSLDPIKEWLNSLSIKYYESRLNLNWKTVLQKILEDPDSFLAEGGWEFLNLEASESEEEEEEGEEAYEPSDVDDVSEEEDDDSEDDESVVDSEEDDEEEEEEEEEEEGLTWDELEEKARREDKEKGEESDSEEDRRRRKKGGGRPGGSMGGGGMKGSSGMKGGSGMRLGGGPSGRPGGGPVGRPGGGQGPRPLGRPSPSSSFPPRKPPPKGGPPHGYQQRRPGGPTPPPKRPKY